MCLTLRLGVQARSHSQSPLPITIPHPRISSLVRGFTAPSATRLTGSLELVSTMMADDDTRFSPFVSARKEHANHYGVCWSIDLLPSDAWLSCLFIYLLLPVRALEALLRFCLYLFSFCLVDVITFGISRISEYSYGVYKYYSTYHTWLSSSRFTALCQYLQISRNPYYSTWILHEHLLDIDLELPSNSLQPLQASEAFILFTSRYLPVLLDQTVSLHSASTRHPPTSLSHHNTPRPR